MNPLLSARDFLMAGVQSDRVVWELEGVAGLP